MTDINTDQNEMLNTSWQQHKLNTCEKNTRRKIFNVMIKSWQTVILTVQVRL